MLAGIIVMVVLWGPAVTLSVEHDAMNSELRPNPSLAPAAVVHIQLQALASNDVPYADAGIEVTFRFASPNNRRVTGPLEKFGRMVKNPVYRPMLNHVAASYGDTKIEGHNAYVPVLITARNGTKAGYVFVLSQQQSAECERCWMTDQVSRLAIPADPSVSEDGIAI
jgi:hypothetical protein